MENAFETLLKNVNGGELGLTEFFFSISFSVIIGFIVYTLYRIYFNNVFDRNDSLAKSFIIIAPSVCSIFWAIQYSLPLSLGLLGALSFVRFRAPVKKGEDIGFILAVIALSLLTSIYRFYAAGIFILILTFIILIKILFDKRKVNFLNTSTFLSLFVSTNSMDVIELNQNIMMSLSDDKYPHSKMIKTLAEVIQRDDGYSLRYTLKCKKIQEETIPLIIGNVNKLGGISKVEVFVENT